LTGSIQRLIEPLDGRKSARYETNETDAEMETKNNDNNKAKVDKSTGAMVVGH